MASPQCVLSYDCPVHYGSWLYTYSNHNHKASLLCVYPPVSDETVTLLSFVITLTTLIRPFPCMYYFMLDKSSFDPALVITQITLNMFLACVDLFMADNVGISLGFIITLVTLKGSVSNVRSLMCN